MSRLALIFFVAGALSCGGGGSPMAPSVPAPGPSPVAGASPDPSPTPTPTPQPSPTPTPAPTVVRRASMRGANGHVCSGTVEIVQRGGSYRLEFRDDFRINGGVNDVYLTRQPGGITSGDLNLGDLRSLSGSQNYAMPDDGAGYPHVMIWCRAFRVPIGLGDLR